MSFVCSGSVMLSTIDSTITSKEVIIVVGTDLRIIPMIKGQRERIVQTTMVITAVGTLTLTIGDRTYTSDSEGVEEALASLNLPSWPDYTITPTGSTWTLSYGKLNTTVYELDPETGEIKIDDDDNPVSTGETASWSLTPPEQDGYTLIDSASASGEYEGIEADTWYYLGYQHLYH